MDRRCSKLRPAPRLAAQRRQMEQVQEFQRKGKLQNDPTAELMYIVREKDSNTLEHRKDLLEQVALVFCPES